MLAWAFFPWLFFITLILLYFKLFFPGSTVLYVFLPAALSLFPALYWALGIWTAFRAGRDGKQKGLRERTMTRLEKENGIGRVLRSAAGCMICAAAAVVGDIVFLLLSGQAAAELPGTAMLLAAALTALGTMNQFRKFNLQTEKGGGGT